MGIIPDDLTIRLEYLNNTAYLFHKEYGWWDEDNNHPTDKLLTIIKQNDSIIKNRWGNVVTNETFIYPDVTPAFDIVIPSYWNIINNEYPKSNGIEYITDLKLFEAQSWDNIDELNDIFIPKESLIDESKIPIEIPNDQYINYIPIMSSGYAYINDSKIYVYPNKVTLVIKTYQNKNIYYFNTNNIGDNHPVYIYKKENVNYDILKYTCRLIINESDDIFYMESIRYNNDDESAIIDEITPYIPIQKIDDNLKIINELSYTSYKIIGNQITNIIKDYDYINLQDGFLYLQEPHDGIVILIFNKRGYNKVIPKNVDLSPITWKSNDRLLSIIDKYKEPYHINIISPINYINNIDMDLPITLVLYDIDGVPIKGEDLNIDNYIILSTSDGNIIEDANIEEIIYNNVGYYKISNIPIDTDIILNNSISIGKIHDQDEYIIFPKQISIPSNIITTGKYGNVNINIHINKLSMNISNIIYYIRANYNNYSSIHKLTIIDNQVYPEYNAGFISTSKVNMIRKINILDINNNIINTEDQIYGGYVRAYTIPDWNDNIDNYIHVPAYNNNITSIDTSQLSGTYVLVYDKILPTWSIKWQ